MNYRKVLFSEYALRSLIRVFNSSIKDKIESLSESVILNTGQEILSSEIFKEFQITVPRIVENEIFVSDQETRRNLSPTRPGFSTQESRQVLEITYHVPYGGDRKYFECRTRDWGTSRMPHAIVLPNELQMSYISVDSDPEKIKVKFEADLSVIKHSLVWIETAATRYNSELVDYINSLLANRRDTILKNKGTVASLGYPLKKRPGAATTYIAPLKKKIPIVNYAKEGSPPFEPEPMVGNENYDEILNIISNMVLVMERSPSAFWKMREEDLRSHFLVQLNGQFEGKATGETFNFEGKTDILVREKGKNIFIAECKFWTGEVGFSATIDQLLKYTSWRDTKTAILIFNHNKDFSEVLKQIKPVVEKHKSFVRFVKQKSETEFRFILRHKDDPQRELTLTVLVFNIPVK
jgi:hypothetical protein